jgi:ubiquinol oxidase
MYPSHRTHVLLLTCVRIESLLEESYNERMHLLVFLKMQQPGRFMRLMVLGAQGVWCNALFFAYLISPRTVHRFVGYLEEEAVITYTRQIQDLDAGRLPKWEKMQAPEIAVDYWNMPEGHRTMRDLLMYSMCTLMLTCLTDR